MGKNPDDIAREIGGLRQESSAIIDELTRRAQPANVVRNVSEGAREKAEQTAANVRQLLSRQAKTARCALAAVEANPRLRNCSLARREMVAGAGAAFGLALGGLAVLAAVLAGKRRRSRWDAAKEGAEQLVEAARQSAASAGKRRGSLLSFSKEEPLEPDAVQILGWAALSFGLSLLCTAISTAISRALASRSKRSR